MELVPTDWLDDSNSSKIFFLRIKETASSKVKLLAIVADT
jgi:hypothetical protein